MPISALPQAPYRQDNKLFPTPLVGDVLFSEIRDCNRGNEPFPAYGTPHPNADKWPNHKLVYIKPVQIERNEIFEFFYAADRENQDLYNFQYLEGGFVLNRSYVILRSELDTFNEPADGTVDVQFSEYKYATRNVKRIDEKELDSLYVNVEHIYSKQGVEIAKSSDSKTGYSVRRVTKIGVSPITGGNSQSQLDEKGWTNQTESVIVTGGTIASAREQKPFIKIDSNSTAATIPTLPATGNGSSQLVYDNGTDKVYQNTVEVSTARTGPAGSEKDVKPYVALTANKTYSTTGDISAPTGSSNVIFNDGQTTVYEVSNVTASAKVGPAGTEKDSKPFVALTSTKTYSTTGDISAPTGSSNVIYNDGQTTVYEVSNIQASPRNLSFVSGKKSTPILTETVTTEYKTVPTGTGTEYSSDAVYSDSQITIYKVDSVEVQPRGTKQYSTVVHATVPSVLNKITPKVVQRKDGRQTVVIETDITEGYTGAFPAQVKEYFTESPPDAGEVLTFKPKIIEHNGVLMNISIGPTLHGAQTITENIGTNNPDYEQGDYSSQHAATEPTSIPSGYQLFGFDVEPYRTGYIVKEIRVKYK